MENIVVDHEKLQNLEKKFLIIAVSSLELNDEDHSDAEYRWK